MPITTSTGEVYEDEFQATLAQAQTPTYDTKLNRQEEESFQLWKLDNAPKDSGHDYDLRGAFMAGLQPSQENGHWPDTFKKPNHPTFSNESIYAADRPDLAGKWDGETFIPPSKLTGDRTYTGTFTEDPSLKTGPQKSTGYKMAETFELLKNKAGGALSALGETAGGLDKIMRGEVDPTSDEGAKHITDAAPLRQGVGTFGGSLALKNLGNDGVKYLNEAKELLKKGVNPDEVWGKTGFYKDVRDGQMKFEIPDYNAVLKANPKEGKEFLVPEGALGNKNEFSMTTGGDKLGDILDHPILFKAYPELKNVKIVHDPKLNDFMGYQRGDAIVLGSEILNKSNKEVTSVLLHEIQHWIQIRENFGLGGVPASTKNSPLVAKFQDDIWQEYVNLLRKGVENLNPKQKEALSGLRDAVAEIHFTKESRAMKAESDYRNLPGEKESYNVQNRYEAGMNRKNTPGTPHNTENMQIITPTDF